MGHSADMQAARFTRVQQLAQWLYSPEEVWPYLREGLRLVPGAGARRLLGELARCVIRRVEYTPDPHEMDRPDQWRSPAETLWLGRGGCVEMALVLWSAAPLLGLPRGRLAIGTLGAAPHAWVEFPELNLYVEVTAGLVADLPLRPEHYRPALSIRPPAPAPGLHAEPPLRPARGLLLNEPVRAT